MISGSATISSSLLFALSLGGRIYLRCDDAIDLPSFRRMRVGLQRESGELDADKARETIGAAAAGDRRKLAGRFPGVAVCAADGAEDLNVDVDGFGDAVGAWRSGDCILEDGGGADRYLQAIGDGRELEAQASQLLEGVGAVDNGDSGAGRSLDRAIGAGLRAGDAEAVGGDAAGGGCVGEGAAEGDDGGAEWRGVGVDAGECAISDGWR